MNIAVLGEGAWGSAIALLLADNGYTVTMWFHDKTGMEKIQSTRYNQQYLPDIQFPQTISFTTDLSVVARHDIIFEAIPVQFLREVISNMPFGTSMPAWVILSKGMDTYSAAIPSQLLDELLPYHAAQAVVYGPSFAQELAHRVTTCMTLAGTDQTFVQHVYDIMHNDYCLLELRHDVVGVQWCGILKNVLALGLGMLEGAGYGKNTVCYMLTLGLQEMQLFVRTMGGDPETVYALCGVGDVVLTSFAQGRNKQVGQQLGAGKKLSDILHETGYIPESINTVYALHTLLKKQTIPVPIFENICLVITEDVPVKESLAKMLESF